MVHPYHRRDNNLSPFRLLFLHTLGTRSLCPSEDVIETPNGHITRSSSILLVKCLIISISISIIIIIVIIIVISIIIIIVIVIIIS
jgi:hypothetical protein